MKNLSVVLTKNNSYNKIFSQIRKYNKIIKFIELRIDTFYPEIEQIKKVLNKIYSSNQKIILTFRTFSEGGKIKISDNKIIEYITNILKTNHKKIQFLDIEIKSKNKQNLISLAKKYNKKIIFSMHLLDENEINNIKNLKNLVSEIIHLTRISYKHIIKIVLKIDNFNNYWDTLKFLYSKFSKKNISFFTIGKTSLISRLIAIITKMPIIFVSLTKPVIKSQPDIKTIVKNLEKLGFT